MDEQGGLHSAQDGDKTIQIRLDEPMPHPLGKVRLFGGIHTWQGEGGRTPDKHLIAFVRVSEREPVV